MNGHVEVVKFLVEHGADRFKHDMSGENVLSLAILFNQHRVIELLSKLGGPD